MKRSFFKVGILALFLAVTRLAAQHTGVGVMSIQPALGDRCNISTESRGQRFIVADFNNDQKPDSITLRSLGQLGGQNLFGVRVCDSGRVTSLLTFESTEPWVNVTAIDVNRDGSPDIVVEQRYTQKRIQIWLNDGHGRFRQADASDFPRSEAAAPCRISAQSKGRHHLPRRAHLRRGNKLNVQKAQLPGTGRYSPSRYRGSLTVRVQMDLGGPKLSRAPPIGLHLQDILFG